MKEMKKSGLSKVAITKVLFKTLTFIIFTNLPSFALSEFYKEWGKKIICNTLSNGMKILILPKHETSTVSFLTYVSVGSVDEKPLKSGLAHLVEHILLFEGTESVGISDCDSEKINILQIQRERVLILTQKHLQIAHFIFAVSLLIE